MFVKIFESWNNSITRKHARSLDQAVSMGLVADPAAAREKMLGRMRLRAQFQTMAYHASNNRNSWHSIVSAWNRVNMPIQPPTAWLDITGKQVDMIDLDAQLGDKAIARTTLEWARANAAAARENATARKEIVLRQMLGDSWRNYAPRIAPQVGFSGD